MASCLSTGADPATPRRHNRAGGTRWSEARAELWGTRDIDAT
jgi:hypothetical protein